MGTIPDYPAPQRALDGSELTAAWQDGEQIALPVQTIINAALAAVAPEVEHQVETVIAPYTALSQVAAENATSQANLSELSAIAAQQAVAIIGIGVSLGGWQDVAIDRDGRVVSGYHPLLGSYDSRREAVANAVSILNARVDALAGGGAGPGESVPRVGGWISANVDTDGRVVAGLNVVIGEFPPNSGSGDGALAAKVAQLRSLRLGSVAVPHPAPPKVSRRNSSAPLIPDATALELDRRDLRLTPGSAPLIQVATGFPWDLYSRGGWVSLAGNEPPFAAAYSIRFITDSSKIEARLLQVGEVYVKVDAMPVSPAVTAFIPGSDPDGAPHLCIDFGDDVSTIRPRFTVVAAGAGYSEGDVLTIAGAAGGAIKLVVTALDTGGAIDADGLRVVDWGTLTALQAGAVAAQGGTGTGATVRLTNDAGGVSQTGHTTRRMRRIEIVIGNGNTQIGVIRVTKSSTVRPWPIAGPRLMVMQDSYGQVFLDRPGGQWAYRMADRLGIEDAWLNTIGGTGFTAGSVRYVERLADIAAHLPSETHPLIFVTQGSINDTPATDAALQAAVQSYWTAAFAALPDDAVMVQTGILRAQGNNPNDAHSAAVRDGFTAACAIADPQGRRSGYIETRVPLEMMTVPDAASEWISGDAAHPTQSGHDYIGDSFAPELLRILQSLSI